LSWSTATGEISQTILMVRILFYFDVYVDGKASSLFCRLS
jgi:hypothetical protein